MPIFVDVNQMDEIDHRVQGGMEDFGSSSQREREGGGLDMPALLIHVSFVTDWMTEWLSDGRTEQCLQYYLLSHRPPPPPSTYISPSLFVLVFLLDGFSANRFAD